jgi:hypothetical protein
MGSMTVGGILTMQACQTIQLRFDGGQFVAQRKRKEGLRGTALSVICADLAPAAQQPVFVARLCTKIIQASAKVGNAHWEMGGAIQNWLAKSCGRSLVILSHIRLR